MSPVPQLHGIATILLLGMTVVVSATEPAFVEERNIPISALAEGQTIKLPPGRPGYRLISLSQFDADVQLQVTDAFGRQWSFDAPARRAAPERACIRDDGRGLTLVLRAAGVSPGASRSVRLQLADAGSEREAECLESRAALIAGAGSDRSPEERAADYQRAADLWKRRGNASRAGNAALQGGWMLARHTTDHVKALALARQAREAFRAGSDAVGEALSTLLAAVPLIELVNAGLDDSGRPVTDEATLVDAMQTDLRKAISIFDSNGPRYFAAQARMRLAASYYARDDVDAAIRLLGEAADRYRAAGERDGVRAMANRSFMLYQSGRYREAVEAFRAVLDSGDLREFPDVRADVLDNSATTQSAVGNYDQALSQFIEALSIQEPRRDFVGAARSLNGMALTYLRLGNATAALEFTQRASSKLTQADDKGLLAATPTRLTTLMIAGDANRQRGSVAAAEAAHREVLSLAPSELARARARLELARDFIDRRDSNSALETLAPIAPLKTPAWEMLAWQLRVRRAQALLIALKPEAALMELAPIRGVFVRAGAPELELEMLESQVRAQIALGKIGEALVASDEAVSQLKTLRLVSGNPELRARLNDVYRSTYALRVEVLGAAQQRAKEAPLRRRYETRLFSAADEARAGLARSTPLALDSAGTDGSVHGRLAAEISLRQNALSAIESLGAESPRFALLRTELADLQARFDSLTPGGDAPLPVFNESDYSTHRLRGDTAVLMFVQSAGQLRRFYATRDGMRELESVPVDLVRQKVRASLQLLSAIPARDPIPALRELSGLLLPAAKLLAGREHLVVVGDAVTASVPFSALSTGANTYAPVIAAHDVTMALTLRDALLIGRLANPVRRIDLRSVAVFSDPVFTATDERVLVKPTTSDALLDRVRLASTVIEARAIRTALPRASILDYSGTKATRAALLSTEVSAANVLHLATHAFASDQWPNGSGLLLSALDESGNSLNGYVSTLDLFSRRSGTELVVLSACETARGESGASESVAGLARAVLGGGSRRVVGTLWRINDVVGAKIMGEFYERLAAGDSAAQALAAAQRSVSATSSLSSPARWAAFVVYERPD